MKRYEFRINGERYELRRSNSRSTCIKCALLYEVCNEVCLTASRQLLGANGKEQLRYYLVKP